MMWSISSRFCDSLKIEKYVLQTFSFFNVTQILYIPLKKNQISYGMNATFLN